MDARRRTTREGTFIALGGRTIAVREATAADLPQLREFFSGLCDASRRLRFFATTRRIDEKILRGMIRAEGHAGTCILACDPFDGSIVGAAQYAPEGPGVAEVAIAVSDSLHGLGIGTELLHRAAAHAVKEGITRFTAMVLAENNEMLHVFRDCGLTSSCHMNGPIDQVLIELLPASGDLVPPAPETPGSPLLRAG